MRRTESSVFKPTISASPCDRAQARYDNVPGVQHVEHAVREHDALAVRAKVFAPRRSRVDAGENGRE